MFHLKLKEIFNDSISKVCSNINEFVYHPGKDYSRVRTLSSDQGILFPRALLQPNANGLIFFSYRLKFQLFLP